MDFFASKKASAPAPVAAEGAPGAPAPAEAAPGPTVTLEGLAAVRRVAYDRSAKLSLCVKLQATENEAEDSRPALDVVAVLDKSGSMSGKKMADLKQAVDFVTKELRSQDRLGLVTFDTNVSCDLPMRSMDSAGQAAAASVISSLRVNSMTNLSGGLLRGIEELREHEPAAGGESRTRAVLLLTDGLMNHGITDKDTLVGVLRDSLSKLRGGASVFAFALGSDSDGDTLRALSEAGESGSMYFISGPDDLATGFGDALGGLLSVVAQRVVVRIEAQGGARIERVLTKFPTRVVDDGKVVEVTLPDLYAGEEKDLLVCMEVPKLGATVPDVDAPVAKFSVSFADAIHKRLSEADATVCVARPTAEAAAAEPGLDERVLATTNRFLVAEALEQARVVAEGDLAKAKMILDAAAASVRGSFPASATNALCVQLLADMELAKETMQSKAEWSKRGRHAANNMAQEHYYQRCSKASMAQSSAYRVKGKARMVEKMMKRKKAAASSGGGGGSKASLSAPPPPPAPKQHQQQKQMRGFLSAAGLR